MGSIFRLADLQICVLSPASEMHLHCLHFHLVVQKALATRRRLQTNVLVKSLNQCVTCSQDFMLTYLLLPDSEITYNVIRSVADTID